MTSLRPIATGDAPAILAAVQLSRDALGRWMSWYRDDYDLHAAKEWVAHTLAGTAAGTDFHFAIVEPAQGLIGIIGFEDMSDGSERAMLGYWLTTNATGHGIGRRAVALAVEWMHSRSAIRVVWAIVAETNVPSRRVLEVNRFRSMGIRAVDERGDNILLYELDLPTPAMDAPA